MKATTVNSPATSIILAWNTNPESEAVTEYRVWERAPNGTYDQLATIPAPPAGEAEMQHTVSNLSPGPHTYAVSAVNLNSEVQSNDATMPGAPTAPTLRILVEITVNP